MTTLADFVWETSATSGTGNITVIGAQVGFRTIASAITVGQSFPYSLVDGNNREVGIATLLTSTTFSRDTVLSSTNSGEKISLSGGSTDVFITLPAAIAARGGIGRSIALGKSMYFV